jgi:hypothetical protein
MSLPVLNWKALPLVTLTSGTIGAVMKGIYDAFTSSVYIDGSPRVTGSASAWTFAQELSGSTVEAVWGIAPTGSLNQRVVLAGSSRTGLTPFLAFPDTAYAPATLYTSVAKNASTYTTWNGAEPFSSGSFFGYWKTWVTSSGTPQIVRCLESQEAIAVFIQNTTANNVYGSIAGAILDPESTDTAIDSETDNRLYGIVTTGTSIMAINNSDIGTAANMFAHGTVAGNNHMGIFTPNTGSIKTVEKNTRLGTIIIEELTSRSGRLVKMPIITKFTVSPINFAGRLREIWMFRDAIIGNTVTNGATVNGYIIGNNTSTIADCVLFSTGST